MTKRKRREWEVMSCPVCGGEVLIPIGGKRRSCSRACRGEMRVQIRHIERYAAGEVSAYVLARAYVHWVKTARGGAV